MKLTLIIASLLSLASAFTVRLPRSLSASLQTLEAATAAEWFEDDQGRFWTGSVFLEDLSSGTPTISLGQTRTTSNELSDWIEAWRESPVVSAISQELESAMATIESFLAPSNPRPLARQGHWAQFCDASTGLLYYYHLRTGESQWEAPTRSFPSHKGPVPIATHGAWGAYRAKGTIYYFNIQTGASQWQPPYPGFPVVPPSRKAWPLAQKGPWAAYDDGNGAVYYFNADTGETTWIKPCAGFPKIQQYQAPDGSPPVWDGIVATVMDMVSTWKF